LKLCEHKSFGGKSTLLLSWLCRKTGNSLKINLFGSFCRRPKMFILVFLIGMNSYVQHARACTIKPNALEQ
jgi:hypothetical protein